jgi:hypothetical protein
MTREGRGVSTKATVDGWGGAAWNADVRRRGERFSQGSGQSRKLMYEDRQLGSGSPVEEVLRRLDAIEGRMARLEGGSQVGRGTDPGDRERLANPEREDTDRP